MYLSGDNFPVAMDTGDAIEVDFSGDEGACVITAITQTLITCSIPKFRTVIDQSLDALIGETRQVTLTINGETASLDVTLDTQAISKVTSVEPASVNPILVQTLDI